MSEEGKEGEKAMSLIRLDINHELLGILRGRLKELEGQEKCGFVCADKIARLKHRILELEHRAEYRTFQI
jgi:hypothetical protein